MGSETLPSVKAASAEGDRPGRSRRELCPEKLTGRSCVGNALCSGENDEEIGAGLRAASAAGVKKGRPAATAGNRLALHGVAQHQNPIAAALGISGPSALLAARAVGIPKILSVCEPRLAQLQSNICHEGEKLHPIIGFPFQLGITLSRLKITQLTFFP